MLWIAAVTLLLVAFAAGAIAWQHYVPNPLIAIRPKSPTSLVGEAYVSGSVRTPGIYPVQPGETVDDIIRAAGGINKDAPSFTLKLNLAEAGSEPGPQRVDLNRAGAWLLEALPGIGETKAQAIIDYRNQHGKFHNVLELTEVPGITSSLYEQIKDLVTVSD